jgi:hypothetical protein
VVAVECSLTWYWRTDLWAPEGLPVVLGHARAMKAIHGGKANNDQSDSQKIAVLLRGGMRPQASVDPAAMRANAGPAPATDASEAQPGRMTDPRAADHSPGSPPGLQQE